MKSTGQSCQTHKTKLLNLPRHTSLALHFYSCQGRNSTFSLTTEDQADLTDGIVRNEAHNNPGSLTFVQASVPLYSEETML